LNLANMLLARGAGRRKELAVRLAVGADRGRLIRQLLTESLSLAIAGALLGLMLAYWATGALSASLAAVMPIAIALDPAPDGRVLAATVLFAVLSTVGFGLGPALRLSRRDLVTDLKDSGADAPRARRLLGVRNLMVVGQVALSLGLLVAGGIFVREAVQASHTPPGYAYDNLFIATAAPDLGGLDEAAGRRAHAAILEAVRALPGIERAGSASTVPFVDEHSSEALERVGAATPAGGGRARASRIVGADYFAALGLPMIRGREFTLAEEQAADVPAVVIVDAVLAASLFGDEDPIGQTVRLQQTPGAAVVDQTPMQVVGVAPPIKDELLDRGPASHVYLPLGRHYRSTLHVHARALPGADEQTMTAALRTALATADARVPVLAVSPMRTFHDRSLELWALRAGGQLFAGLGILAVALAMIGLYGLKSFVVAQRTREIGIRIALGATRADVLRLVFRDGLALLAIGLAVGVPIAIAVSMTMGAIFVGLGGFDPLVVALAAIALTTAAVAATLVPARRASRISPLTALRSS
jgi:predicted permease